MWQITILLEIMPWDCYQCSLSPRGKLDSTQRWRDKFYHCHYWSLGLPLGRLPSDRHTGSLHGAASAVTTLPTGPEWSLMPTPRRFSVELNTFYRTEIVGFPVKTVLSLGICYLCSFPERGRGRMSRHQRCSFSSVVWDQSDVPDSVSSFLRPLIVPK